ncbi:MAG: YggS family pyridoxal phosphate-dependent enzyme [Saprospiraceae bacterium]|nr:YggS family pyridoxal phosphate-dependent enzyme [Saprospiraceae bacterium]MCB9323245.1 YggS family pyridoxal phosphate-dependent enzyme [Lewinellaceae bacterium]
MFNTIIAALKPYQAKLVAVSKTKSEKEIMKLYDQGQRIFGENRVQELLQKTENLPKDIEWHEIGHLQTNKISYIAPFIDTVHAVDSLKVLKEINKEAQKHLRVIKCLLQFKIAQEETKFGLDEAEGNAILLFLKENPMEHVRIVGVMGMATFTDDMEQVRQEFKKLKGIFDQLKANWFAGDEAFCEISMGMSGDYEIALEEGATMVRIGTLLFGERE